MDISLIIGDDGSRLVIYEYKEVPYMGLRDYHGIETYKPISKELYELLKKELS